MNHAEQILINEKKNLEIKIADPLGANYTAEAKALHMQQHTEVVWALNSIKDDKI